MQSFTVFLHYLHYIGAAIEVVIFFGMTILIHEGGHFLAAKLLGLRADVFSIGFGPALWKRRRGETEYRICAIPFGGYVALPQLDPSGMDKIQGGSGDGSETMTLEPAAWWKRIIVAVAGPLGNVIFATVLALIISVSPPIIPESIALDGAVVGAVVEESDAAKAGIRPGDQILKVADRDVANWNECRIECHLCAESELISISVSNIFDGAVAQLKAPLTLNDMGYNTISGIVEAVTCGINSIVAGSPAEQQGLQSMDIIRLVNGKRVLSVEDFVQRVTNSNGEPVTIDYLRGNAIGSTTIIPELMNDPVVEGVKRYMIGASLGPVSVSLPQWAQYRNPLAQLSGDARAIFRILEPLVGKHHKGERERIGKSLGGPIMIITSLWLTILSGFVGALGFIRYVNVNLAILNLLPLPVLDGGHIVFALFRGIFRREIPQKLINVLVNIFAFLLIGFFIYISFRDIGNVGSFMKKVFAN